MVVRLRHELHDLRVFGSEGPVHEREHRGATERTGHRHEQRHDGGRRGRAGLRAVTVPIYIPARDLRYFATTDWDFDKGAYKLEVGPSADPAALQSADFTLN